MTNAVAKQIAELPNSRNQLSKVYTTQRVLAAQENIVFIEEDSVVKACAEVKKVQWYQTEICHVSVAPHCEGQGFASRILHTAEHKAITNDARLLQCTIRADNDRSTRLFEGKGYSKTTSFFNKRTGNWVNVYQKTVSVHI